MTSTNTIKRATDLHASVGKQRVVDAVIDEAGGRSVERLAHDENEALVGLLALREGMPANEPWSLTQ